MTPPRIDRNVIDTLVMKPSSNKAMIKALCETYSQKEDREMLFFADSIRGKGEGQILLLHGPPGTGKTLTAGKAENPCAVVYFVDSVSRICCRVHGKTAALHYCFRFGP